MIYLTDKKEIDNLKKYLDNILSERVMKGYNDGWYNKWVQEKIKELEDKIIVLEAISKK